MDAIGCEALMKCENENIKSVLFAFPALIYVGGDINKDLISDDKMNCLIMTIQNQLPKNCNNMLNLPMLYQTIDICSKLYLEQYEDSLPTKGKSPKSLI